MKRITIFIFLLAFGCQQTTVNGQQTGEVKSEGHKVAMSQSDCISDSAEVLSRQKNNLSVAKSYYDSAYQCLLDFDYLSAMPKLIKISELIERLPEDMSDEEMHLTSRAYYQMGEVFMRMFIPSYETEVALRAARYQEMRQDSEWMLYTKIRLASSHQVMGNIDSVDYYIKQIIPLSDSVNHLMDYYKTLDIIAQNYYEKKDYDTAFYLLKEKIKFKARHDVNTIGDSISLGIMMFHSPYKHQSKPYLLKIFDKMSADSNANMRDMGAVASLLAELYEEEGNEDSLAICNRLLPEYIQDMSNEKADDMSVRYMYENFKAERDKRLNELRLQKLLKEKKRNRNIVMSCVVILLIISSATMFVITRKKNKKQWSYDEAIDSLLQSDIVKRIKTNLTTETGDKITVKNMEEYSGRKLYNLEFVELRNVVDKCFEGRLSRMVEQYPELMSADIYCCCLSLIGFTNTEMAILFGVKYNAINSRISKIKKIFNTEENLRDFVVKKLIN